jgi:hypothetical protein
MEPNEYDKLISKVRASSEAIETCNRLAFSDVPHHKLRRELAAEAAISTLESVVKRFRVLTTQ